MSETQRPFVVRRKKVARSGHSGSWKIALADFMTALMALFLVLWLLSRTSEEELKTVAEYFRTPLLVAMAGGPKATASTSAIPGGGPDPQHAEGEQARIYMNMFTRPAEVQRNFFELENRINNRIMGDPELRELRRQMRIRQVPEGLLIQLLDNERRPMFELGSDKLAPYMSYMLRTLAPILNDQPNSISISGHTDNHQYPGESQGYSNWELSADRANASRRELMAGGMAQQKVVRIVGMADTRPMSDLNASDPVNRRIELLVLAPELPPGIALPTANANFYPREGDNGTQ